MPKEVTRPEYITVRMPKKTLDELNALLEWQEKSSRSKLVFPARRDYSSTCSGSGERYVQPEDPAYQSPTKGPTVIIVRIPKKTQDELDALIEWQEKSAKSKMIFPARKYW
ncbi:MAG: hypothetical protein WCK90_05185 [archaeon]